MGDGGSPARGCLRREPRRRGAGQVLHEPGPATGGSLLTWLSNAALLKIVNWNFCAGDASLCDDGDACTADACGTTGGCTHGELPAAASFLSVACRIDDLTASAQAGVPAGTLQSALAVKLQSAKTNTAKGEMLRDQGKKRPAKRAIGKAIKALKGFERKLTFACCQGRGAGGPRRPEGSIPRPSNRSRYLEEGVLRAFRWEDPPCQS